MISQLQETVLAKKWAWGKKYWTSRKVISLLCKRS
jgi:hypothetical protein